MKNTHFLSTELTLQPFETKRIHYFHLQYVLVNMNLYIKLNYFKKNHQI